MEGRLGKGGGEEGSQVMKKENAGPDDGVGQGIGKEEGRKDKMRRGVEKFTEGGEEEWKA